MEMKEIQMPKPRGIRVASNETKPAYSKRKCDPFLLAAAAALACRWTRGRYGGLLAIAASRLNDFTKPERVAISGMIIFSWLDDGVGGSRHHRVSSPTARAGSSGSLSDEEDDGGVRGAV
jgi:hypothetical protein